MPEDIATAYANALADLIAAKVAARLEQSIGDDILTVQQAADLLKFHPTTVTRWAKDGTIPSCRIGSDLRFRRSALLNHVTPSAEIHRR